MLMRFKYSKKPKAKSCFLYISILWSNCGSAVEKTTSNLDLVIADEAHRCAGETSSEFANVLNEHKIRADKRLFTTATPRVISKSIKTRAKDPISSLLTRRTQVFLGTYFIN